MAELGAGAGSGYPAAIDTKQTYVNGPNPVPDSNSRVDQEFMNDGYDALVKIQTELGIAPSGVWDTVVARLNAFLVGSVAVPQLVVAGAGPHAIGGAVSTDTQVIVRGAFTAAAGSPSGFRVFSTLTAPDNGSLAGIRIDPTLVESGAGTHPDFVSLLIEAPAITPGAAALTNASTLKIISAPTGATNNYALWVDAGLSRFDGAIALDAGATSTIGPHIRGTSAVFTFQSGTDSFRWDNQAGTLERMRLTDGGILALGTTVMTGAVAGDLVLANAKSLRFVDAAGTTSANYGLLSDSGNNLQYHVPAITDLHRFAFAGTSKVLFQQENGGAGLVFEAESSADHAAASANQAIIYIKDNGAGKTQIVARFNTGAVQVIATEP